MIPTRIGILVPSTNTSVEADFQRVVGRDITIHTARLYIPDGEMTPEFLDQMNADLDSKVRDLASANVDVIAYCCTSGSFYKGTAWDKSVVERASKISGRPCITTSLAVAEALSKLGIKKMSVMTPYPEWTNEKLTTYYQANGFEVASINGDVRAARGGHRAINDQNPDEIREFAVEHVVPGVDGIFCSCTAWRAFEAIPDIEIATGLPVVSSNQATIWAVLSRLGKLRQANSYGRLFQSE